MLPDERTLPTPAEFVRKNFVWILGLIPIAAAGVRILTASGGDSEVFLYLLRNLNVVQLVLATIMPLVPLGSFWALIAWIDWKRRTRRATQNNSEWIETPIIFILVFLMSLMAMFYLVISIAVLVVIILVRRHRTKKSCSPLGS